MTISDKLTDIHALPLAICFFLIAFVAWVLIRDHKSSPKRNLKAPAKRDPELAPAGESADKRVTTAPTPVPKNGTDDDHFIDGPVVYTGPVVLTLRKGKGLLITEGGQVVFDALLHKRQVIRGDVHYQGGVTQVFE